MCMNIVILELAHTHAHHFAHSPGFGSEFGHSEESSQEGREFMQAFVGQDNAHDAIAGVGWDASPEVFHIGRDKRRL
jgi:hypothetical protein